MKHRVYIKYKNICLIQSKREPTESVWTVKINNLIFMKMWSGTKISLLCLIQMCKLLVTKHTSQKTIKDKPQIHEISKMNMKMKKINDFVSMKLEIKNARMELT